MAALFLGLSMLAGCAGRPARAPSGPPAAVVAPSTTGGPVQHTGPLYTVDPEESLLTVLVFRSGALAKAGHNHVIASHSLSGMVWAPEEAESASFEIHFPVAALTIDEPKLRALEGKEFAADVPDSAREGTKKNMLSEALLDGAHFPEVVLQSGRMERGAEGMLAQVSVSIRGQTRTVTVPLRYEIADHVVRAQGQFPLRQTDLGLTPFSLLGGALSVADEMTVKFSVVARGE